MDILMIQIEYVIFFIPLYIYTNYYNYYFYYYYHYYFYHYYH